MSHGARSAAAPHASPPPPPPSGAGDAFDRRGFLGSALAALAAAALPDGLRAAGPGMGRMASPAAGAASPVSAPARLDHIGLQLYTVRGEAAKDLDGTLARVAKIGYDEVEFAGYYGHAPADVHRMLDRYHLLAPAAHVPLERIRGELDKVLEEARVVGHHYVVCPFIDEKERTADALADVAVALNKAGAAAREKGFALAYHNHDFEFTPLPDGRKPYDLLLSLTEPDLVDFEMDLFWATKGGADPLAYFKEWPGRFTMVHVKDMDAAGNMVDVGKGRIDFARIFAARLRGGIVHAFVEHDEPADPWASITNSYNYLDKLSFGTS